MTPAWCNGSVMRFSPWFVLGFAVLLTTALEAQQPLDLPNPGFEEEFTGWVVSNQDNGMSKASAEAARNGQAGLRVEDRDSEFGSSLFSGAVPAEAGKKYAVKFWARNLEGEGLGVYLIFFDSQGRYLNKQELKNENIVSVPKGARDWEQFTVEGVAPDEAASLKIWIHSFTKNHVSADVDDFSVLEITE